MATTISVYNGCVICPCRTPVTILFSMLFYRVFNNTECHLIILVNGKQHHDKTQILRLVYNIFIFIYLRTIVSHIPNRTQHFGNNINTTDSLRQRVYSLRSFNRLNKTRHCLHLSATISAIVRYLPF